MLRARAGLGEEPEVARRKSLLGQLYQAHKNNRAARERARAQAEKEYLRDQARAAQQREAERKAAARAEERRVKEAAREAAQQERRRLQDEADAHKNAERAERERSRRVEQGQREQRAREQEQARLAVETRRAEARSRTDAVYAQVASWERLLLDRATALRSRAQEVEAACNAGGPAGLTDALHDALSRSVFTDGLDVRVRAAFHPESRELVVDCELPRQDVVPRMTGYRYIQRTDEVRPDPRKDAEIKRLYRDLVARVTLRSLAEIFYAAPVTLVDSVILNGFVSAKDRATGRPIRPCIISVEATRGIMDNLLLDEPELDPVLCLGHMHAIVSPHPYDLEAVKPVTYFDPTKYKLIDEVGSVAGLDSRLDLLTLSSVEFEYLVRRLFEEAGMTSWVKNTQASRDEGVDAVAVNEDPIVGGVCVIQAKRWKDTVGLESVHALAGVMADKSATRGILVTTSWFGKASRDFVNRHGRMQLIDGRNLKEMLRRHLELDVLIGLPKLPPGWERRDIA